MPPFTDLLIHALSAAGGAFGVAAVALWRQSGFQTEVRLSIAALAKDQSGSAELREKVGTLEATAEATSNELSHRIDEIARARVECNKRCNDTRDIVMRLQGAKR